MKKEDKKTKGYYFGSLLLFGIITLFFPLVSHAKQSLPPSMLIGDDSGVYASQEGDYYIDLPNILPGEVYDKDITIRSFDLKEPVELSLLVEPIEKKGSLDFNKHIKMTLTEGEKELYSGPILGDETSDWTKIPLVLGVYQYGDDRVIHVKFEISDSLTNLDYQEDSELLFKWTFVATKNQDKFPPTSKEPESTSLTPEEPVIEEPMPQKPVGRLPWTGEQIRGALYKILSGFLLIMIVLLLWKKRKDQEKEE